MSNVRRIQYSSTAADRIDSEKIAHSAGCQVSGLLRLRRLDFLGRVVNDPLLACRRTGDAVQSRAGEFGKTLGYPALLADENSQLFGEEGIDFPRHVFRRRILRGGSDVSWRRRQWFGGLWSSRSFGRDRVGRGCCFLVTAAEH